ncbi:rhomboid family intramembrane serine protease [Synechococcales cyanobacterium C]|uniref:Rhomboid family intramembrane serine protease n=1 Tax=Petrachloros mirabilis ULC683 TaxID=2781853 RepID=A0A8K2A7N3_9CYAN|nr:rhomboid family intramembrane serine protease [Petrachloros mirabilis]NCJ06265.1 rhomboid family intramembrane serine protease [Petrachloros mirabilis ULC683]
MQEISAELRRHAYLLGGLLAIMWGTALVNFLLFQNRLLLYGIRPLSITGLRGILFAPFLHAGLGHLMSNTIPFAVLGWLIMARSIEDFVIVSLVTMGVAGLGTWLLGGAGTLHVGASGVVFGYLGYLLLRGYFERSLGAIVLAVGVGVLYGGLLWGVLPTVPGISWQGHLFGFIGGGLAARLLAKSGG